MGIFLSCSIPDQGREYLAVMTDLSRFEQFLAFPTEDVAARSKFALSQSEIDELHTLAVKRQVSWDFYHDVNKARKADFLFQNGGREKGWTIAKLKNQLSQVQHRNFAQGDERVQETISNLGWPFFRHIKRTRESSGKKIEEVELAFPPRKNPEALLEKYEPGFEEEDLLLLQAHQGNEHVSEMAFLPPARNEYWIILSCGGAKKRFQFPIALRYKNLLKQFAKMYPMEDTEFVPMQETSPSHPQYGSYELGEAHTGLWLAVRDYDSGEVSSIPGYINLHIQWHMQDQRKAHSTEAGAEFRDPGNERILNERLEHSGGELDAPIQHIRGSDGDGGSQQSNLKDVLTCDPLRPAEPLMADEHSYYRKIMNYLPDTTDRKIVWGLVAMGLTQAELAQELKMTQSAVAQRLAKIRPKIKEILAS